MNARDLAFGSNLGLRISSPSTRSDNLNREAELMLAFMDLKRTLRDVEGDNNITSISVTN
jgi:hypothetical protein